MKKGLSESSQTSIKRIGILLKSYSPQVLDTFDKIISVLKKHPTKTSDLKVFVDTTFKGKTPSFIKRLSDERLISQSDLILSVGGDGTLLRAARLLLAADSWNKAYLLGINAGRLGFLTLVHQGEITQTLHRLLNSKSKPELEKRACLEVQVNRAGKKLRSFHILNDAVIKNGSLSRLIEYKVHLDREFLSSYRADGLIISTPTGSTAYNLAAGGAILEPLIPAIQLTPICAQSFSNKPILVSDKHSVRVDLEDGAQDVYLTLDGHTAFKLKPRDQIQIRKSTKSIRLVLPSSASSSHYLHSLRQKLKWGLVSPRSA